MMFPWERKETMGRNARAGEGEREGGRGESLRALLPQFLSAVSSLHTHPTYPWALQSLEIEWRGETVRRCALRRGSLPIAP